jgi:hypothetical protein
VTSVRAIDCRGVIDARETQMANTVDTTMTYKFSTYYLFKLHVSSVGPHELQPVFEQNATCCLSIFCRAASWVKTGADSGKSLQHRLTEPVPLSVSRYCSFGDSAAPAPAAPTPC